MKTSYVIWHDNDYDLALWVYNNSDLKQKEYVKLKAIPKSNDEGIIAADFTENSDYFILPYIKFATPDILIQKIENDRSKILFATEFMTQTPQHDHVFQRFERIYCISNEKVPVAFVFPQTKAKLERGSRKDYVQVLYHPNPLAVHVYLKTTQINKNPTLMFFWPDSKGYLKLDPYHPTAPMKEGQVVGWIKFLNLCLEEKNVEDLLKDEIIKSQIDFLESNYLFGKEKFYTVSFENYIEHLKDNYSLSRVNIMTTKDAIDKFKLDKSKLSKEFLKTPKAVIFSYKSQKFRTDPYCGFVCGFKNLFCLNAEGKRKLNLIHVPSGIKYTDISGKDVFKEYKEDVIKCPLFNNFNFNKFKLNDIKRHLKEGCIYTLSKQQRIFATVSDVVVFEDKNYFN